MHKYIHYSVEFANTIIMLLFAIANLEQRTRRKNCHMQTSILYKICLKSTSLIVYAGKDTIFVTR